MSPRFSLHISPEATFSLESRNSEQTVSKVISWAMRAVERSTFEQSTIYLIENGPLIAYVVPSRRAVCIVVDSEIAKLLSCRLQEAFLETTACISIA